MKNIDWDQAINNFIFRTSFVIGILFLVIGLISSIDGTIDKLIEYIGNLTSNLLT